MASIIFSLCLAFLAPVFAHGIVTISDCGGPDKSVAFRDGSIQPDPVQYPGTISIALTTDVLKDLPADNFGLQLNLFKLDPFRLNLPCINGLGSCSFDVCQLIENNRDSFCPFFPNPNDCGCPIKVGSYIANVPLVVLPDYGQFFRYILQGSYEGEITFFDKSSNAELGCVRLTFDIVPNYRPGFSKREARMDGINLNVPITVPVNAQA